MGKERIKIVLADAQFLPRAGFKSLFSTHAQLKVVAEATDREELAAAIAAHRPEVVVMDHHNTAHFSIDDLAWIQAQHPEVGVLLVTEDQDPARIRAILGLGVGTILTKHCSPEEIVSATMAAARRERFFCNKVLDLILEKQVQPEEQDCSPTNLTQREAEIVALIAKGISTKEIADRLCLSLHTVYTHRKNIMKKLSINSVSEMILYAMNAGLMGK